MPERPAQGRVRALVCEDEPLARRAMREYLADVEWVEIVGEAKTGRESLRLIHKLEPALVFLDVRMPGMDGLEVLEAATHSAAVVFTTAYDEYALEAFEHGAVDYLVKPFGRERLIQTLDRVRIRLVGEGRVGRREEPSATRPVDRIFARYRGAMVPVAVTDIRSIEAVDGGVEVRTDGRTLSLDVSLTEIGARLDPRDFVRVHRGQIVHLGHVASIERYDERRLRLTLDDGTVVLASRSGSRELRTLME